MAKVLTGGRIVTPLDTYIADLRIEDEKICEIGNGIAKKDDEVIDVTGCYVMPGAIDTHTHFDLDVSSTITADNFETGSKAAICGGTTTILDFATQDRGDTLINALNNWHKKADNKCHCDYGFHMAITDWNDNTSKEMKAMIDSGVSSFKMYMAYKQTLQVDDGAIYEALKRSVEVGGLIGFHCENGDLVDELIKAEKIKGNLAPKYHPLVRPSLVEKEAAVRLFNIAELAESPVYVVHLSTKDAYDEAIRAKERGVKVYLETCPQYLLLNKEVYETKGDGGFEAAKYVISPPLRDKEDNKALWQGIIDDEIDTIGTDHCSFNYKGQKDLGKEDFSKIPNGAPGVEHRVLLLYKYGVLEGRISINKMSEMISTNAAKLFGLYPRKGSIALGSDADIVVINPNKKFKISKENQHQNVDYTPYEGREIDCFIEHVFLRGNHMVSCGRLKEDKCIGKFIKRNAFEKR